MFISIGNTCRSPMAEAILRHLINKKQLHNWHTDSAGLRDWNVGLRAQGRAQDLLQQHGLKTQHLSRIVCTEANYENNNLTPGLNSQITAQDFYDFDYIFGMDECNLAELQEMAAQLQPQPKCRILLLGSYLNRKEDEIIQDPYFVITLRCTY